MKKFLISILLLSYFALNIVQARGVTRTLRSVRKETYDNSSDEYDFENRFENPTFNDNAIKLGPENQMDTSAASKGVASIAEVNNIHVE